MSTRRRYFSERKDFATPNAPTTYPARITSYLREDQADWLRNESARRLRNRKRSNAREREHEQDIMIPRGQTRDQRRTDGKLSEIVREAVDLLIEYYDRKQFTTAKARQATQQDQREQTRAGDPADDSALVQSPIQSPRSPHSQPARSPESATRDPQSSGNGGPS